MQSIDPDEIDKRVVAILRTDRPMTIPEIERKLGDIVDTFDVRDAVWRLIERNQAKFTPRRLVLAVK